MTWLSFKLEWGHGFEILATAKKNEWKSISHWFSIRQHCQQPPSWQCIQLPKVSHFKDLVNNCNLSSTHNQHVDHVSTYYSNIILYKKNVLFLWCSRATCRTEGVIHWLFTPPTPDFANTIVQQREAYINFWYRWSIINPSAKSAFLQTFH